MELLNGLGVVAQILLATNKNDGKTLAEVQNLGNPLKQASAGAHIFGRDGFSHCPLGGNNFM